MFLGALCIVCVFAFLFLVPFVLDPAISTLMHQFVESPVHCRVSFSEMIVKYLLTTTKLFQLESYELRYGKSNCSWASCREGCTAEIFKCHQLRVTYTPKIEFLASEDIDTIDPRAWAHLTRTEKQVVIRLWDWHFSLMSWLIINTNVKHFFFKEKNHLSQFSPSPNICPHQPTIINQNEWNRSTDSFF